MNTDSHPYMQASTLVHNHIIRRVRTDLGTDSGLHLVHCISIQCN